LKFIDILNKVEKTFSMEKSTNTYKINVDAVNRIFGKKWHPVNYFLHICQIPYVIIIIFFFLFFQKIKKYRINGVYRMEKSMEKSMENFPQRKKHTPVRIFPTT
jgi:hypothetical protein